MTARRHLSEKGLIKFDSGNSRFLPSNYYLLELTADLTHGLTLNNKDKDKDFVNGQNQNSHYDTSSIKNRRRSIEIRTASAEDYEAAF